LFLPLAPASWQPTRCAVEPESARWRQPLDGFDKLTANSLGALIRVIIGEKKIRLLFSQGFAKAAEERDKTAMAAANPLTWRSAYLTLEGATAGAHTEPAMKTCNPCFLVR
jgi:hypothetical protein